jgi:hypothetical protein
MNYIFVTTCHEKKIMFFCFFFFNFFFFDTILKHDAHVCVLIIMYMFVNCICARYIKACIYQGLNPRLHGNTLRSSPPNHFDTLWIIKIWKSVTLSCLAWNCLGNSNATNENMILKFTQQCIKKIKMYITYKNWIYNVKKIHE